MPPSVNCCHFPPYSFAPITRLCLTFCNFGSPLLLTLLSTLHLRPPFPGTSCVCLALSAILAPKSTQNTEHRLRTHNTNTENIRPPYAEICDANSVKWPLFIFLFTFPCRFILSWSNSLLAFCAAHSEDTWVKRRVILCQNFTEKLHMKP